MSSWKDDAEINRLQLDAECARMPVVYQRWISLPVSTSHIRLISPVVEIEIVRPSLRKRIAREIAAAGKVVKKGADSPPPSSEKGFGAQKGRLSMPLRGRLISGFGRHKHAQFNSYTVSNGLSIAAPAGADVRAIYEGTVIFAEYFKGYGNMVIVDHGGGYFSLYAHNSRIAKRAGTSVAKNDILASVGDIDSANGPMLYFEIRYQGKPVDPSAWVR